MAISKKVQLDMGDMGDMDSQQARDMVNQDFQEDPNKKQADVYQEDPEVIAAANKLQRHTWQMKVALHQKEFDTQWKSMSGDEQEAYSKDLSKEYQQRIANQNNRSKKVNTASVSGVDNSATPAPMESTAGL
jgi:hypothetical protein